MNISTSSKRYPRRARRVRSVELHEACHKDSNNTDSLLQPHLQLPHYRNGQIKYVKVQDYSETALDNGPDVFVCTSLGHRHTTERFTGPRCAEGPSDDHRSERDYGRPDDATIDHITICPGWGEDAEQQEENGVLREQKAQSRYDRFAEDDLEIAGRVGRDWLIPAMSGVILGVHDETDISQRAQHG